MTGGKFVGLVGDASRRADPRPVGRALRRASGPWTSRAVCGLVLLALGTFFWLRPRRVAVNGPSMEPTLKAGDRLLVIRGRPVKAGSIVALVDPNNSRRVIVKRVTAVRREEVIVRGDNADASVDSRTFGPVPRSALLGTVVRRYAPAARAGVVR